MTTLKVIKSGLLTTVQDTGRTGYQQYGVPVSGVMDHYAHAVANLLVGNTISESVLEVTMMGPKLEFQGSAILAVTGGDLQPQLNGIPVPMWKSFAVNKVDILSFKGMKSGCRAYLAFLGGIQVPQVLGSSSTYTRASIGGYQGRRLQPGDVLELGQSPKYGDQGPLKSAESYSMDYPSQIILRVVEGPQDDAFTKEGKDTFYGESYRVTNESDRMGFRLEGPEIQHVEKPDIISDGIAMGAIQVPGHGCPIVMMADRQTAGGYTKIVNVITADLPKIAQAKPGDEIRFQRVTVEEAQQKYRAMIDQLISIHEQLWGKSPEPIQPPAHVGKKRQFTITVNGNEYNVLVEERST